MSSCQGKEGKGETLWLIAKEINQIYYFPTFLFLHVACFCSIENILIYLCLAVCKSSNWIENSNVNPERTRDQNRRGSISSRWKPGWKFSLPLPLSIRVQRRICSVETTFPGIYISVHCSIVSCVTRSPIELEHWKMRREKDHNEAIEKWIKSHLQFVLKIYERKSPSFLLIIFFIIIIMYVKRLIKPFSLFQNNVLYNHSSPSSHRVPVCCSLLHIYGISYTIIMCVGCENAYKREECIAIHIIQGSDTRKGGKKISSWENQS